MHFVDRKSLYLYYILLKFIPIGSRRQKASIGSGNGWALKIHLCFHHFFHKCVGMLMVWLLRMYMYICIRTALSPYTFLQIIYVQMAERQVYPLANAYHRFQIYYDTVIYFFATINMLATELTTFVENVMRHSFLSSSPWKPRVSQLIQILVKNSIESH